jgi:hypothetical protein
MHCTVNSPNFSWDSPFKSTNSHSPELWDCKPDQRGTCLNTGPLVNNAIEQNTMHLVPFLKCAPFRVSFIKHFRCPIQGRLVNTETWDRLVFETNNQITLKSLYTSLYLTDWKIFLTVRVKERAHSPCILWNPNLTRRNHEGYHFGIYSNNTDP